MQHKYIMYKHVILLLLLNQFQICFQTFYCCYLFLKPKINKLCPKIDKIYLKKFNFHILDVSYPCFSRNVVQLCHVIPCIHASQPNEHTTPTLSQTQMPSRDLKIYLQYKISKEQREHKPALWCHKTGTQHLQKTEGLIKSSQVQPQVQLAPESNLATSCMRLTVLGDDIYCSEGWALRFQQVLVSDSCNSIYSVSGVR